jgi:hypothetical protein
MPLPKETIRNWVINHQHWMVVNRYADIDDSDEIRNFFAKYLYPSVEDRAGYESRNEFFRILVDFYRRGKIGKMLGAAAIVMAPIIWMADRMKELPDYLQKTVDLYDMTNELDGRLCEALAASVSTEADLTNEAYEAAYRISATPAERRVQVLDVVGIGQFVVKIVERGGIVDLILEHCPRIPFFANNQYVRGLNDTINMVQAGFRAFRSHKGRLHEFAETCRDRELAYVESVFGAAATEVVEIIHKT